MLPTSRLAPYSVEFHRLGSEYRGCSNRKLVMRSLRDIFKAALLAFAILIGLWASAASAQDARRLVKTQTISTDTAAAGRTFFGQIAARETVDLGFQVDGRITEFTAPEGELLAKGTPIARLDQEPYKIDVERARLAVE